MRQEIARLLPRHKAIMDLALDGLSQAEIARRLCMGQVAISYILRSPLVQQELARKRAALERARLDEETGDSTRARATLENAALKAAEVQVSLLEEKDPRVALAASNSILDRVFQDKEQVGAQIVISAESVQLLNLAIKETRVNKLVGASAQVEVIDV